MAKKKLQNFIDGKLVDPVDGKSEDVLNPATGEVIATAPLSTAEDVNRAVAAARKALPGWAGTTPGERSLAMIRLADALDDKAEEFAKTESLNAGKPYSAMLEDEMPSGSDNLRFYASSPARRGRCRASPPVSTSRD